MQLTFRQGKAAGRHAEQRGEQPPLAAAQTIWMSSPVSFIFLQRETKCAVQPLKHWSLVWELL